VTDKADCFCHGMVRGCRVCGGTGTEPCSVCHGIGKRQELIPGTDHDYRIVDCMECFGDAPERQPHVIGLTPDLQNNLLEEMDLDPFLKGVADQIRNVLQKRQGWGVFYGPNSRGKSYALAAALNAMPDYGLKTGRYVQVGRLFAELQEAANGKHGRGLTLNALETEIINAHVVCFDELNWISDNPEDFKHLRIREIIDSRSEVRGYPPTFFATNKDQKWFQEQLSWLSARFERGPVFEVDFGQGRRQKSRITL